MAKVTDLDVASKFIQIEQSASDRGFKFNLTLRTVRRLLNTEKCFFTGKIMTSTGGELQRSFDRIDNRKGYVEGNMVACCRDFNSKKGSLTIDDIKLLYLGLKKKKLV